MSKEDKKCKCTRKEKCKYCSKDKSYQKRIKLIKK